MAVAHTEEERQITEAIEKKRKEKRAEYEESIRAEMFKEFNEAYEGSLRQGLLFILRILVENVILPNDKTHMPKDEFTTRFISYA